MRASAEAALVLGRPIKLKRGQCAVSFSQHNAAEVEDMQESEINAVLALMAKNMVAQSMRLISTRVFSDAYGTGSVFSSGL